MQGWRNVYPLEIYTKHKSISIKYNTDLFKNFVFSIKSSHFNNNIVISGIHRPSCKHLNEFINIFPDYL